MIMRHMNIPMNLPFALEKYFVHMFNEFLLPHYSVYFSLEKNKLAANLGEMHRQSEITSPKVLICEGGSSIRVDLQVRKVRG